MPEYTRIVSAMSADKFNEVIDASSRKAKEVYFHRHNIKAPKTIGLKVGLKNEVRIQKLYETLQNTKDEELCEELLRTWLLTKRPMLSAAMDYLKIPHDNGLTDSDELDKIPNMSKDELEKMVDAVSQVAPREDVEAHLRYMGAQF